MRSRQVALPPAGAGPMRNARLKGASPVPPMQNVPTAEAQPPGRLPSTSNWVGCRKPPANSWQPVLATRDPTASGERP